MILVGVEVLHEEMHEICREFSDGFARDFHILNKIFISHRFFP